MADIDTTRRTGSRGYTGTRNVPTRTHYREGESLSSSGLERMQSGPRYQTPFALMRRLADDMDNFFSDFGFGGRSMLGRDLWRETGSERSFWAPEIETFRRGDELVVRADLPGMNKENVNIEVDDDALIISGEREDEQREERDDYYRSERSYGRFYRAVPLPDGVDPSSVNARFKDGVLEITTKLPKESAATRKRVEIK